MKALLITALTGIALNFAPVSAFARSAEGWNEFVSENFPKGVFQGRNFNGDKCRAIIRHFSTGTPKLGVEVTLVTFGKKETTASWVMSMDPKKDKIETDSQGDSVMISKSKNLKTDGDYEVDLFEQMESMWGRDGFTGIYLQIAEVDYVSDPHEDRGECFDLKKI